MLKIEIPGYLLVNYTESEVKEIAAKFKCIATAVSSPHTRAVVNIEKWVFETDDPVNFFWLGMNMAFKFTLRELEG